MSVVLMIYARKAFKTYVLPSIHNADYSIVLNKIIYGLENHVELKLEVGDIYWRFVEDKEVVIRKRDELYYDTNLQNGDILEIENGADLTASVIVTMTDSLFHSYQKLDISRISEITIGKDESNIICYNSLDYISRNHAKLSRLGNEFEVIDTSSNGIFVNSKRVNGRQTLAYGDSIEIFGLNVLYYEDFIAVSNIGGELIINHNLISKHQQLESTVCLSDPKKKSQKFFFRSPRTVLKLFREKVEIEQPPAQNNAKEKPILYTIGPSFTMVLPMLLGTSMSFIGQRGSGASRSIMMFTGIITCLGSAIVGVTWAILNYRYAKKEKREQEELRFNSYGNYLKKTADFITEKYKYNTEVLMTAYPNTSDCLNYNENTPTLWNRNYTHEDFLFVRLGLGELPFQAEISAPNVTFQMIEDKMMEKPLFIKENYQTLYNVPVGVNLLEYLLLGIVGGKDKIRCTKAMQVMATQIATNNCYTDVKMVFIYDKKQVQEKDWEFVKWLPHVWSADGKTRYVGDDVQSAGDVFYELSNILRRRMDESNQDGRKTSFVRPHYIIFIQDTKILLNEGIAKTLLNPAKALGITTILFAEDNRQLPNECRNILDVTGDNAVIYDVLERTGDEPEIKMDQVDLERLNSLATRLANIKVNESESSTDIRNSLDFFEMYDVSTLEEFRVLERWKKNRNYDSMKALIGKKQGDTNCYLDIHEKYHGPHGLIAGTTGSGKSETLQTYMLSLAINFSPDDIGFFVIDFKGGGMANLFSDLPHMIGQISNLSGNQVHRAMVSIKSENKRRQRVFAEHGVNNINLYTRLVKNKEAKEPIPHLFIIIDEFAELKREEPEFMKELISVAQVGRSLGVHLILATQKPSGTVDDNIWSNTKFRLCLRVQDKQDSNDMLHKPDAAYITQAGRCYLQVGNDEIYELFQSGWSGAVYDETATNMHENIASMITLTGKTAIVGSKTKVEKKEQAKLEWLNLLANLCNKIADELGVELQHVMEDSSSSTNMIDQIYQLLRDLKIDYSDSTYNRQRLIEFIQTLVILNINDTTKDEMRRLVQYCSNKGKKLPEIKEKTQLDAVVEYLGKVARNNGYTRSYQLWLPVLKEKLYLSELEGYDEHSYPHGLWEKQESSWNLIAYIGLYDDPENQAQHAVTIDFSVDGHIAICGSIVSGKSTLIQTILYSLISRYTPKDINFYIMDFSSHTLSAFENCSHVGGVVTEDDLEKVSKLFNMLEKMMEERKKILNGGNYSQYVRAHGVTFPVAVVVIDNYASFREKTNDAYDSMLIHLSRDGAAYGIYLLISSGGFGGPDIQNRIGDNIKTSICLDIGDRYKYAETLRIPRIEVMPEPGVKGRGLVLVEGNPLEFQAALSIPAEDDYKRAELIKKYCETLNQAWEGSTARKIPVIPEQPVLSEFVKGYEYNQALETGDLLPIGYNLEDASYYSIELNTTYSYLISGRARTGRMNAMKVILRATHTRGAEICVIDNSSHRLNKVSKEVNARYIDTDQDLFNYFSELMGIFVERNNKKYSYVEDGFDDQEIYEKMKEFPPIFIFISDLMTFLDMVYNPDKSVGNMSGFFENICEKGSLHNIYLISCYNIDDYSKLTDYKAFYQLTSYKKGLHCGGNLANQRMYNFSNISYQEQGKTLKPGIAYTPSSEDDSIGLKVVLPLVRG